MFSAFKTCKNYTKTKELCMTFIVQFKNHAWTACHTLSLSCHTLSDALIFFLVWKLFNTYLVFITLSLSAAWLLFVLKFGLTQSQCAKMCISFQKNAQEEGGSCWREKWFRFWVRWHCWFRLLNGACSNLKWLFFSCTGEKCKIFVCDACVWRINHREQSKATDGFKTQKTWNHD